MAAAKKTSLLNTFISFSVLFVLVTVVVSAAATWYIQNRIYYNKYKELLKKVNHYFEDMIDDDIDEFVWLQKIFDEHYEDFEIPFEYANEVEPARYDFEEAFVKVYPGRVFGMDVTYDELSEELQLLYARYLYLKALVSFDEIRDDFSLDYTYYVYPTGDGDNVYFMFDGLREEVIVDGRSMLKLRRTTELSRSAYNNMWSSLELGAETDDMDSYSNEYGHVYTYSTPVVYEGKTIGLILTDVSYNFVKSTILRNVIVLVLVYLVVLGLCSLLLISLVKNNILLRLSTLEQQVGMYAKDKDPELAGVIASGNHINDEIGSLSTEFSQMIVQLHEYMDNLTAVTAEKEKISAELNVAAEIQASMLPRIFPPFPDRSEFSLFASMDPAKEVGGDFYDFFMVDEDHIALVMADVSGKGVPAALFMAISKVLIKDNAQANKDPGIILKNTNEQLCEGNDAQLFVTVWLGIIDINTGVLTFSDAGHEYPVLIRTDGSTEFVKAQRKDPPVAIFEEIDYHNSQITLYKGETLFLYTDGVPEAGNSNNEFYGMERLEEILKNTSKLSVEELLPRVRADVDQFVDGAEQFDDLTMLAFRLE